MRSILLVLPFAISVSLTALAQQTVAIAPEAQSSRALSAASYLDRGNGWLKKGEFERAIADYSLAIAFDPRYAGAYFNRGLARSSKGDVAAGLADFNRAIELNPRDAGVWSIRGVVRQQQGDFDAALA